MKYVFLSFSCIAMLSACTTVKPYQRVFLNDEEMRQAMRSVEQFESNFEVYREGASGASGGKTGGGCGCN